jgi:hypothetical protein
MESEYRGRIIGLKMESEYRGRIIGLKMESEYRGRIIGLKMERLHDRIISLRGKNRDHKTSSDFNKPGK